MEWIKITKLEAEYIIDTLDILASEFTGAYDDREQEMIANSLEILSACLANKEVEELDDTPIPHVWDEDVSDDQISIIYEEESRKWVSEEMDQD